MVRAISLAIIIEIKVSAHTLSHRLNAFPIRTSIDIIRAVIAEREGEVLSDSTQTRSAAVVLKLVERPARSALVRQGPSTGGTLAITVSERNYPINVSHYQVVMSSYAHIVK